MGMTSHIGEGKVLLSATMRKLDELVQIEIPLVHHGRKGDVNQGKVIFNGKLELTSLEAPKAATPSNETATASSTSSLPPLQLPAGRSGCLRVSDISVKDLVNLGSMLDGQDPCVRFRIGKDTQITSRQVDAGSNASFTEVFEFRNITAEMFNSGKYEVRLKSAV